MYRGEFFWFSLAWVFLNLVSTGLCKGQNKLIFQKTTDADDGPEQSTKPKFISKPNHFSVEQGSHVTFPCEAKDFKPFVLLLKYVSPKGNDRILFVGNLTLGKKHRRIKSEGSNYLLTDVQKVDRGKYVCRFETDPPVELKHTLDVQYPAEVKRVTPAEQRVRQGDNVKLQCKAEGNPYPAITWHRKKGHLPSGAEKEEGLSITLENVDRHVEGTYICTASNGVGNATYAEMKLLVEYPPEINTQQQILHTGEGDNAKLMCLVHGRPQPRVTWQRNGSPVASVKHLMTHDGAHRHTLTIQGVDENDFGGYTCVAKNRLGERKGQLTLTGLPKKPHMTSNPYGGEEGSYTLTWLTESVAPIMQYRLMYRNLMDEHKRASYPNNWMEHSSLTSENERRKIPPRSGLLKMKHRIPDLHPATDYEAKVMVENKFGWSDWSDVFRFNTRKELAVEQLANRSIRVTGALLPLLLIVAITWLC